MILGLKGSSSRRSGVFRLGSGLTMVAHQLVANDYFARSHDATCQTDELRPSAAVPVPDGTRDLRSSVSFSSRMMGCRRTSRTHVPGDRPARSTVISINANLFPQWEELRLAAATTEAQMSALRSAPTAPAAFHSEKSSLLISRIPPKIGGESKARAGLPALLTTKIVETLFSGDAVRQFQ
jgi:hypothetical protein